MFFLAWDLYVTKFAGEFFFLNRLCHDNQWVYQPFCLCQNIDSHQARSRKNMDDLARLIINDCAPRPASSKALQAHNAKSLVAAGHTANARQGRGFVLFSDWNGELEDSQLTARRSLAGEHFPFEFEATICRESPESTPPFFGYSSFEAQADGALVVGVTRTNLSFSRFCSQPCAQTFA